MKLVPVVNAQPVTWFELQDKKPLYRAKDIERERSEREEREKALLKIVKTKTENLRFWAKKVGAFAEDKQADFMPEEDEWKEAEEVCKAVNKILKYSQELLGLGESV